MSRRGGKRVKVALDDWIRERRKDGLTADEDIKAAQIARRILISYGGERGLRDFLRMLKEGYPGTEIASRFGVTRQRANQWKDAVGVETTSYEVRPLLRGILGENVLPGP